MNDKDKEKSNMLEKGVAEEYPATDTFYQHFRRTCDWSKYKSLQTDDARKEYRKAWAERSIDGLKIGKSHSHEWKEVDIRKGAYETLELICEKYGYHANPRLSLERSTRYCARCAKLGGKWVIWDDMAEAFLFLYLKKEHQEIITESWKMYEEYEQKASPKKVVQQTFLQTS